MICLQYEKRTSGILVSFVIHDSPNTSLRYEELEGGVVECGDAKVYPATLHNLNVVRGMLDEVIITASRRDIGKAR